MAEAEIGLIGLGVMGASLALNIRDKGYPVAVFNRTPERTRIFADTADAQGLPVTAAGTIAGFVSAIRPPRSIILMVQAGEAVDEQIGLLRPLLAPDDLIIDAGNANFRDTIRRTQEMEKAGLACLGLGVSGGEEGARHGPSLMAGGTEASYRRVEAVLNAIAARYEGEPCAAWLGPGGAGHFVKTIHNGIEYADMQMIAETYAVMKDALGLGYPEMQAVFAEWNRGELDSYLIEITADVLAAIDADTRKPLVDVILDKAGQKGTGRWSVIEAQMMGVPATAIEAAVAARSLSAMKDERTAAAGIYAPHAPPAATTPQADILAELELALLAGKIAAYAQGFAVMQAASKEFGWNLPRGTYRRAQTSGHTNAVSNNPAALVRGGTGHLARVAHVRDGHRVLLKSRSAAR
jgi:6-phosphogluconate dehydrogenase